MAHELDYSTGRAAIAYLAAGGIPWHKEGTPMPAGASLEAWRVGAGMGWEIKRADVQYVDTEGRVQTWTDRIVLFRSDTGAPLSVMGDGYREVQPSQVLDGFFSLSESQGWALETAGCLRGGRQFWALAKTGLESNGGDAHRLYMLISTSADGSLATSVIGTDVRVVCANTMGMALRGQKGATAKVRHNTAFDLKQIKRDLGLVDLDATWAAFRADMAQLADVRVSRTEASAIFSELLRPGTMGERQVRDLGAQSFSDLLTAPRALTANPGVRITDKAPRAIRGLADLETSYISAPGACPGTGYGVLQAVTHYVDHVRGSDYDSRMSSAWFGQGVAVKERARELVLAGDWRVESAGGAA